MTAEERATLIERIVTDVENWDLDNLIGWVQTEIEIKLDAMTDEQLQSEATVVLPEDTP